MKTRITLFSVLLYIFLTSAVICPSKLIGQSIVNITPSSGTQGQVLTLTLTGQNTNFMQGTSTAFWLNQATSTIIFPESITITSNTEMSGIFLLSNSYPYGTYDATANTTVNGMMTLPEAFQLQPNPNPPYLAAIDPNHAEKGETIDLYISGQNTNFETGTGTFVWFSQGSNIITPNYSNTLSNTLIKANFSFSFWHQPGFYDVQTNNQLDGTLTLDQGFELMEGLTPSITSIVPDNGITGTLIELDIYSENTEFLQTGVESAALEGNGFYHFFNVEALSNTLLHAEFVIPYTLPAGVYSVHVFDQQELILPEAFFMTTNPVAPGILTLNPNSAQVNTTPEVIIETEYTWFEHVSMINVWLTSSSTLNEIYAVEVQLINNQMISALFAIAPFEIPGLYDLKILDNIHGTMIKPASFELIDTLVGIHPQLHFKEFRLVPNPTDGLFQLITDEDFGECHVEVLDIAGRRILESTVELINKKPIEMNIRESKPGFYIVKIITGEKEFNYKIIKH
ncbi:MAG: T9SS type A sorting domain-containing protein [Bacteroidales bacterium]|nr:T9SS type A sorting domain-containing protein [Bacteroidales bacterium]